MTDFQIHALPAEQFAPYLEMSDDELARRNACWHTANANPGFPCRVSLRDAEAGEQLLLINFQHLPEQSPYQASHAIYVRPNVPQAQPAPDEVPSLFTHRLMSVRAYNANHHMIDATVVEGQSLSGEIRAMLSDRQVEYLHLHYAKPGCYAARVTRA